MSTTDKRKLTPAELEQRRQAPTRHGAYSAPQIKAKARAHRRRFLRQAGLKASELDAIAGAYLEGWAHARARVDLFDLEEREREPAEYFAALNSARLSMAKLEARLNALGVKTAKTPAAGDRARAHLEQHYRGEA